LVEAGVKGVILIGGGEPLVHRSIGRVITTLSDGGVQLGMVTNGTLIDRHLDVLADRMSWIRVSVDAATRNVYDRFRPSGRAESVFPKVVANLEKLARVKRGRLGYSFLLMQRRNDAGIIIETNYHQVFEAGKLAKSLGCDYLEVKAVFDAGHFIVNETADDIRRVDEQLSKLDDIEDQNFRVLRSSTWNDLKRSANREQPKEYSSCSMSELRTTITPSGVYPCAYHRGNKNGMIGDVNEMSFSEMWRQAGTQRLDPRTDCRFHCARDSSNRAIEGMERGSPALAVDDYDPFI
jgi:MoaA/NifB/PqqE/SkfB family radical SAM enzyme